MRNFIVFSAFIVLAFSLKGQTVESFATLDKQNYQLFFSGNYSELNKLGKRMIANGMDYYYLRMRLGIAAFNKQRYVTAIHHFKRALAFNSSDAMLHEYIFFSHIYLGQFAEALVYRDGIALNMQTENVKKHNPYGINFISLGTDFMQSTSPKTIYAIPTNQSSYSAEAITDNYSGNIKLNWMGDSKWRYSLNYLYFKKNGVTYNQFFLNGTSSNFNMNQIHIKAQRGLPNGNEFYLFGTLSIFSGASTYAVERANRVAMQLANDYVGGVGVARRVKLFRFDVNASYSNLAGYQQLRSEGFVSLYPFEHVKFYTTHGGQIQYDINMGMGYNVFNSFGFKIAKPVGFEFGLNFGNAMLSARNAGEMLFNSLSIAKGSAFGNIYVSMGKGFYSSITGYIWQTTEFIWDSRTDTQINPSDKKYAGINIQLSKYF